MELLTCPFCGGNKIQFSNKTTGNKQRHVAMFCKDCNSYGKRVLIQVPKESFYSQRHYLRSDIEMLGYDEAVNAWNTRTDTLTADRDKWKAMALELGEALENSVQFINLTTGTRSFKSEALAKLKEMDG